MKEVAMEHRFAFTCLPRFLQRPVIYSLAASEWHSKCGVLKSWAATLQISGMHVLQKKHVDQLQEIFSYCLLKKQLAFLAWKWFQDYDSAEHVRSYDYYIAECETSTNKQDLLGLEGSLTLFLVCGVLQLITMKPCYATTPLRAVIVLRMGVLWTICLLLE